MSETVEITQGQSIRLRILELVGYDTAAAANAIEFVQDNPFKAALFEKQFNRLEGVQYEVIARSMKAIQESKEALSLFEPLTK
jgi:hypothetical protein